MNSKNNKRKGTQNERKCMRHLESEGYVCTRAAGSLGVWDVIAIRKDSVRLIQVKTNRRPGVAEMETMRNFECPKSCSRELWIYADRKRLPVLVEVL